MINLNHLLDVPSEKWLAHGVSLVAFSSNADGLINSFYAKVKGARGQIYGYRKKEFVNGQFTGKQEFVIEKRQFK